MQPFIRGYRPTDIDAVYDICVRTAASGGDARGRHRDDRLYGDLYAAPYVTLEPEHTHLLDAGDGRVVGYIVGTADTARFVRRFRKEWLPLVADRYPGDGELVDRLHAPEQMLHPELAGYPAHLHIDLLPEAQGSGFGRALMTAFLDGLRAAGVDRVHLVMARDNRRAYAFYLRLGFVDLLEMPGAVALGRTV